MGLMDAAARASRLADRQWGLLTTAQAEADDISRLQLSRLAEAGVLERIDRGIYATPAARDERTPLRVAWLSLDPARSAEERLVDPASSGVVSHTSAAALHQLGDLPDDVPEITMSGRKQSRRGIRLHRAALSAADVTIVAGLPTTTAARTVADLLRDGHDSSHIAQIAGDALRQGLASRDDMAIELEPLARRHGRPDGAALLDPLLDLVGLSSAALAASLATSEVGKALIAAGQLGAIRSIIEAVTAAEVPAGIVAAGSPGALAGLIGGDVLTRIPEGIVPRIDLTTLIDVAHLPPFADIGAFEDVLVAHFPTWLPDVIRSLPDVARSASESATPHAAGEPS